MIPCRAAAALAAGFAPFFSPLPTRWRESRRSRRRPSERMVFTAYEGATVRIGRHPGGALRRLARRIRCRPCLAKVWGGPWLVLSGGGENGAFSAGILEGWTAAGTRPDFAVVTGVSTRA